MTVTNIPFSLLASLQDSSGNSPIIGTPDFQVRLYPRAVTPPALPTLPNSVSIDGHFYHTRSVTADTHFSTTAFPATGNPQIIDRGLRLNAGDRLGLGLASSNSWIRGGTWWSEGIVAFTPFGTTGTQWLDGDTTFGNLIIQFAQNNQWQFQIGGGSLASTFTFDNITVPLTPNAPDSPPKYFYYRMIREYPTSGFGVAHMAMYDGSTWQTQSLSNISRAALPNPFYTTFGGGSHRLDVFWFRGIGSDTYPSTLGALNNTYWSSTPAMFEDTSYVSHSVGSVVDSGTADRYWHELDIPDGQFTGLRHSGGTTLQARFSTTNTAPTAPVTFSGSYTALQNGPAEPLNDAQGQYLQLELKYISGTEYPLKAGLTTIVQDSNTAMTGTHFASPQSTPPATIPIPGEGDSQGTLPFDPETTTTISESTRTHRVNFEAGYTHSRTLSTGTRRTYQVRWLLTATEKTTLLTFFEDRDGGEQAFTWTVPGDSTSSKAALNSPVEIERLNADAFSITAELIEVL